MNMNMAYLDKAKSTLLLGWLISVVLIILGYRVIRDIIVFILMKIYEFFIQQNPSHP
ncbi:MAG: hypothetical protein KGO81_10040 [Bacteroidota bacterium]|nr:hypothetical protein [Bacteroidota bacterium]